MTEKYPQFDSAEDVDNNTDYVWTEFQAEIWAMSRSVRATLNAEMRGVKRLEAKVFADIEARKAKLVGVDINADLWRISGRKPAKAKVLNLDSGVESFQMQPDGCDADAPLRDFNVGRYVQHLIDLGRLRVAGASPVNAAPGARLLVREDVLKEFPPLGAVKPRNTISGEQKAGRALRAACVQAMSSGNWPKKVDWKLNAQEEFSIGDRASDRVWADISKDYPQLASRSKPRQRRL